MNQKQLFYLILKVGSLFCRTLQLRVFSTQFARLYSYLYHFDNPGTFQKQKVRKGNHLKMLDSKPGVYTQYQPFLHKDKTILKKVLKGVQTKRPGEVQSALLRRHLLELTQSFMIPLERYMGTLMPLQKNISPFKVLCHSYQVFLHLTYLLITFVSLQYYSFSVWYYSIMEHFASSN